MDETVSDLKRAIDDVAARLGRPVSYVDEQRHTREIVGAAVGGDGRRLAWVESRSHWIGNMMDVDYVLHARVDGHDRVAWTIETYNPFFGCDVLYMAWWGEQVVIIYEEKHKTLVAVVGGAAAPRLYPIHPTWSLAGDAVLFLSDHTEDLVESVLLPDLTRMTPLAAAAAARMKAPLRVAVPAAADVPRFQAALRRELFGDDPPQPEADLIVGALAHRFWDRWPEATPSYPYGLVGPWNSPSWLPFYWHLAARDQGRHGMLPLLDALAARATSEPPPSALAAAAGYVRSRSHAVAAACRAGALPEDAWCAFWVDWSLQAILPHLGTFPPGFSHAFELLRPQRSRWNALSSPVR